MRKYVRFFYGWINGKWLKIAICLPMFFYRETTPFRDIKLFAYRVKRKNSDASTSKMVQCLLTTMAMRRRVFSLFGWRTRRTRKNANHFTWTEWMNKRFCATCAIRIYNVYHTHAQRTVCTMAPTMVKCWKPFLSLISLHRLFFGRKKNPFFSLSPSPVWPVDDDVFWFHSLLFVLFFNILFAFGVIKTRSFVSSETDGPFNSVRIATVGTSHK